MKVLAIVFALVTVALLSGCIGVGTRICGKQQVGCDFEDHVLTVFQSGTVCPTWNVQFAQYNPTGQSTDTYGIEVGRDDIVATLRTASRENQAVHVWYAGSDYVLYNKCKSDYPLVIYEAEIVQ